MLTPFLLRDGVGGVWRVERPALQALRAGLLAVEGIGFYAAVALSALGGCGDLLVGGTDLCGGAGPTLVLGENVPAPVWAAIGLGFVGVVLALEPSRDSLTPAAGIALLGSLAFAGAMLLGRKLRGTPDTVMVGWQIVRGADRFGRAAGLWGGQLATDTAARSGGAVPAGRGGDGGTYSGEPGVQTCRSGD